MMEELEEGFPDHVLREAFSDFRLQPSERVWEGIGPQVAKLPASPYPASLKLLLPLATLTGVAIGWLAPHPAAWTATPATEIAQPALLTEHAAAHPQLFEVATPATASAPSQQAVEATTINAPAATSTPALRSAPVRRKVASSAATPRPSSTDSAELKPLAAATVAVAVTDDLPVAASFAPPATLELPAEKPFPASAQNLRNHKVQAMPIGYHAPSHRLSEEGRWLRLRMQRVKQSIRHFLNPSNKGSKQPTSY